MKIDMLQSRQAFALVKQIINRENWRCRKCDRLLGPASQFFLPFRPDPTVKRTEALFLRCDNCKCHYVIPRRCQVEIRKALRRPDGPQKPPTDLCPECGQKMQPDGRCFVCRACGFSKCG